MDEPDKRRILTADAFLPDIGEDEIDHEIDHDAGAW